MGFYTTIKKKWIGAPPNELEEFKEKHQIAETCI